MKCPGSQSEICVSTVPEPDRVLEPSPDTLELLILLEQVGFYILAEESSKVEVSGHQLVLHVLQSPLMFHDLQRLPLTLTQTHMGGGGLGLQRTSCRIWFHKFL